ncbi:Bax inhibitor-1 family protein [Fredinandcohnia quinoae]|uniref:Bax inhibitor-1 family protein n=1 Tax=Fredinandcohnia quinoae TaxID=2918902 RepID=A0AAW5EB03_9BACI|nr:Bax inhibitor-1 family protein [Fredinandcohnia sp. SECRCQ15]MCH1627132.1 Bax inhibitor-1 family protein [Fredinandcohnia sp. SECRCQ15]
MVFETLFSKVFIILTIQLLITFIFCILTIGYFKLAYRKGASWIGATNNQKGQKDLHINWSVIKPYFYLFLVANIAVFIALLFNRDNINISILLFSIWSILNGIQVALGLISVDENLGMKVLGITVSVTFGTALIGLYSGVDFSFMGKFLLIALILLVIVNIVRLFIRIDGIKRKVISIFGIVLFTLYLIYDFNKITLRENTWLNALDISIDLYLDILNLFLYLLDFFSNK